LFDGSASSPKSGIGSLSRSRAFIDHLPRHRMHEAQRCNFTAVNAGRRKKENAGRAACC
jgi:hypothetical protein